MASRSRRVVPVFEEIPVDDGASHLAWLEENLGVPIGILSHGLTADTKELRGQLKVPSDS